MIFAHHLAEGFGRKRGITSLLSRLRVVIVPVVNVDGFDYSRESLVDAQGLGAYPLAVVGLEAYRHKNRRSPSGATVPEERRNPDAYGVDPNRKLFIRMGRRWWRLLGYVRRSDIAGP
jgi:murein tripeptide amidase MpaA